MKTEIQFKADDYRIKGSEIPKELKGVLSCIKTEAEVLGADSLNIKAICETRGSFRDKTFCVSMTFKDNLEEYREGEWTLSLLKCFFENTEKENAQDKPISRSWTCYSPSLPEERAIQNVKRMCEREDRIMQMECIEKFFSLAEKTIARFEGKEKEASEYLLAEAER